MIDEGGSPRKDLCSVHKAFQWHQSEDIGGIFSPLLTNENDDADFTRKTGLLPTQSRYTLAAMFDVNFSYASATAMPTALSSNDPAIKILHDFETVIKLSPDCRGCKPIPPPNGKKNGVVNGNTTSASPMSYYEVEDDLPFMPKRLWSGGVKYTADFLPTEDGCDITVHAPGGFTSTNHWRILRETAPLNEEIHHLEDQLGKTSLRDEPPAQLQRTGTRDMHHAESQGAGWYVQIISDARCPRTFAGFVKGFLKNSHTQLEEAFIEHLKLVVAEEEKKQKEQPERPSQGQRRPTLGRRRSTKF